MNPKLCNLCGIEPIKKGRQIYCGSWRRKTGCSYIRNQERKNIYWRIWRQKYPEREEQHRKKVEDRRKQEGYYKTEKKKDYYRKRYLLKKINPLSH